MPDLETTIADAIADPGMIRRVDTPHQILQAGIAACKDKRFEEAEKLLTRARDAYSPGDGGRRTASIFMGMVCRQSDRPEEAARHLEEGLPFPAAFTELAKIFRAQAKEAKQAGDRSALAKWCGRLYSVAKLDQEVMEIRRASAPSALDWEALALRHLAELRQLHGTIYSAAFDGTRLAGTELLTERDYTLLASCRG